MEGRLTDLVRDAVACVGPTLACDRVSVIIVVRHLDKVVVVAVPVQNYAPIARHLAHDPRHIQLITGLESRRPLEDEYDRVSRVDVHRIIERNNWIDLPRGPPA